MALCLYGIAGVCCTATYLLPPLSRGGGEIVKIKPTHCYLLYSRYNIIRVCRSGRYDSVYESTYFVFPIFGVLRGRAAFSKGHHPLAFHDCVFALIAQVSGLYWWL